MLDVQVLAKDALGLTGLDDRSQHAHRFTGKPAQLARLLRMLALVQVLDAQDSDEFGVLDVVVPDEGHHVLQGLQRFLEVQLELAFGFVELLVGMLQHADEQAFLAAEVVVEHAVVGFGLAGNALDPATGITVAGEHLHRRLENACSGLVGLLGSDAGLLVHVGIPSVGRKGTRI